jgi:hypothetical protein
MSKLYISCIRILSGEYLISKGNHTSEEVDNTAAILSDDGIVTKVKNKNYTIGQVIEMKNKKIHITKKLALGIASAAALFLTTGIGAWAYTTPYSYVSLDVNPSIEYTLNRFDRVIDVKAVNDDGQVIMDQIDISELDNKSIEDAILATVNQISQDGYFATAVTGSAIVVGGDTTNDNNDVDAVTGSAIDLDTGNATDPVISIEGGIVITIANGNGEISEELANEIRDLVEDLVSDDVEVEVESVGYERVQKAKELGVTPGKLNLVEKLQASSTDPDSIIIEEWLNKPVKDIMKAIKENKKANPLNDEEDQLVDALEELAETEEEALEAQADAEEEALEDQEEAEEKAKEDQEEAKEKAKEKQEKAEEKAKKSVEKANEAQKKAEEKAKEAEEKATEKVKEAEEKAAEKAKEAKEKAEEAKKRAEEKAKEEQEKALEKAKEAEEKAKEKAEEAQKKSEEKEKEQQSKSEEKDLKNNSKSSNGNGNKKADN